MSDSAINREFALAEPVASKDHVLGLAQTPISIIEYGDYECPDCFNAVPVVKAVRQQLGDRLRFVFRHFPQSSIHPHASVAAQAAEAASEQGKFWDMHHALFAHQKELADLDLAHLALSLGLEIYRFETSRSQEHHRRRIRHDFESGQRSGVTKTPTFFINGFQYVGEADAQSIVSAAESMAQNS